MKVSLNSSVWIIFWDENREELVQKNFSLWKPRVLSIDNSDIVLGTLSLSTLLLLISLFSLFSLISLITLLVFISNLNRGSV